jgi:hypothetical protein
LSIGKFRANYVKAIGHRIEIPIVCSNYSKQNKKSRPGFRLLLLRVRFKKIKDNLAEMQLRRKKGAKREEFLYQGKE